MRGNSKTKSNFLILYGFVDFVSLIVSFLLGYLIRSENIRIHHQYWFYILSVSVFVIIFLLILENYNWLNLYNDPNKFLKILLSVTVGFTLLVSFFFIIKDNSVSRLWIFYSYLISSVFLIFNKLVLRAFINIVFINKDKLKTNVLLVGEENEINKIGQSIIKNKFYGLIGYLYKRNNYFEFLNSGDMTVTKINKLQQIDLDELDVGLLVMGIKDIGREFFFDIIELIEDTKIDMQLLLGFNEIIYSRLKIRDIGGIPLLRVSKIRFSKFQLLLKKVFDYSVSIILMVPFSIILALVAISIKIDSKGPVFYRQLRCYAKNKEFYIYKFRSMVENADKLKESLLDKNITGGATFKIKDDPRITRVGKLLRRFSIDEVPQLLNVLRGKMSLVGPRPPTTEEVEKYEDWQIKRLNVQPGITGLWQVSGRSELTFDDMIKFDIFYIENWSLVYDIKIILKTFFIIFSGKGAY
jgi:exopolysaccharide biosynthesis polyprenyl glycosylphosphotransferase